MPEGFQLTVEGLLQGIYDYCGNPREDLLLPSMVLTHLSDAIQHYRNELDLTDEAWHLEPLVLNVQAGREEYSLGETIGNFGRPFFAETYESNNLLFRRREIKFIRPQDRDQFVPVADFVGASFKHNCQYMSFRNIGMPEPIVSVWPIPTQAAQYRIWHESIITDEIRYADVPMFLKQFFPLLKVHVCLEVIPFCGWPADVRDAIINTRMATKQQYYDTFYNYIQQAYHSQTTYMKAANSSRRGGNFGGSR